MIVPAVHITKYPTVYHYPDSSSLNPSVRGQGLSSLNMAAASLATTPAVNSVTIDPETQSDGASGA